jgi:homoserine kinase type II
MAVKTHFSNQDFKQILSNYDLGVYIHSDPIPQGTIQTNYFVNTSQGKFVFRYYENRSLESVLFESELLRFLREHRFPSPYPSPDKNGSFVNLFHEKPFMLMNFIEGDPIEDLQDHHKNQLIQKVAELQNLTGSFSSEYKEHRWNYDIELCQTLARNEAGRLDTESARKKLSWVGKMLSYLDLPESLPKGICHSDFHYLNILYQDDRLSGLLDFDDANCTYLGFDLVCLIDSWTWPFQTGSLDLMKAREITDTYRRYRLLSAIEQRHIFDIHKLSILFDCVWYFERGGGDDFYEKVKVEWLDKLGRDAFTGALFGDKLDTNGG